MNTKTVQANNQDIQLLDVREDDEWRAGRVEGALHIPLGQLDRRVRELDQNRPVVTVCRSGGRAAKAAELLSGAGLSAQVMDGGMAQWAKDGLPLTTADGRPGHVA